MKKTWKRWLGTVAVALVTSTTMAQGPDDIGVATTRGQSPNYAESDEATIQSGRASASASGIQPTQFVQSVDPGDVFEDSLGGGYYAENGGVGFASTSKPIGDILWRVGRQNLDAYGYSGGYTNINAFVPLSSDGTNSVLFLNPRVNLTDYRRGGANIGLGYRFYDPGDDRVYGVSGWWDYDAGHRGSYNNMGMFMESVGRWMSLRGGFALPVGKDQQVYDSVLGNAQFIGSQVVATRTTFFEQSYANYNFEVATPLPGLARYGFDIGAGMYFLNAVGKGGEIVGTSVRTQAQVTEDLWINGTYTYDSQFNSQFSLNMELTLPDGPPSRWFRRNPVQAALTATALRNYRIAVSNENQITTEVLKNPGGGGNAGQAITVAFIDPNQLDAGDGSLANPFMSLADYMSHSDAERRKFDILYVRRRDDQTDFNLNTTVTLLDYQKMLGDGVLPNGSRPTLVSGQGSVALPGTNGPLPFLSNSAALGSPVITLHNANEVSGFTIDGSGTASGIVGTGIDSFNIHDVFIQNVTDGIVISSNTTPNLTSSVQNYGVIQNVSVEAFTGAFDEPTNTGIQIKHEAGVLDLLVRNNTVKKFKGEDINGNLVLDPSEDANSNGIIDFGEDKNFNNHLDRAEDVNGNSVIDAGYGISISATGGTINAFDLADITRPTGITANTFDQNGNGLNVVAFAGSQINASVTNNTATGGTDANGQAFAITADAGTITLYDLANNVGSGGAGDGLVLTNRNNGTLVFANSTTTTASAFAGNSYTGNGGDGLKIVADNASLTIDSLSGLVFNNNSGDGLELQVKNGGTLTVDQPIVNTSFTNNGQNGLNLNADSGTIAVNIGGSVSTNGVLQDAGNVFTNNGQSGIRLAATAGGVIDTSILNNTITSNSADGIRFDLDGSELSDTTIRNNVIENNDDNGVSILAASSLLGGITFDSNSVKTNLNGDGLALNLKDTTAGVISLTNSVFDNNGSNGINVALDHSSIGSLQVVDNAGAQVNGSVGFSLIVSGDTFTGSGNSNAWTLSNNANSTLELESINFNLENTFVFDTAGASAGPFTPNPANVPVLQSLNGSSPPQGVTDDSRTLNMDFTGFAAGNQYQWDIDVDRDAYSKTDFLDDPINRAAPIVRNIQGSTVTAIFNDPNRPGSEVSLSGTMAIRPGNASVAEFNSPTRNVSFQRGISSNRLSGLQIDATNGSNIANLVVSGNAIDSNRNGAGISITSENSSIATVSGDGISNNIIRGNIGANLAVSLNGSSDATLFVTDNVIESATTLPGQQLAGDGIHIEVADTAVLHDGTIGNNTIRLNAADGVSILVSGNNDAGNDGTPAAQVNNYQILNNTFENNGDDGLQLARIERGQYNNLLVQNNVFQNNGDDGVIVDVAGVSQANLANGLPDTMDFILNEMTGNTGDGIEFRLESDADLLANLDQNLISNNTRDGIYVSENINDARDSRSLTGRWTRNEITDNGFSGIQIQSRVGNSNNDLEAGMGLIIGDSTINAVGTLTDQGNLISGNNLDGIQFTGVGTMTIGNNVITSNGTGNNPNAPLDQRTYNNAGINIQGQEDEDPSLLPNNVSGESPVAFDDLDAPGIASQDVIIRSNLISANVGDGIRWINEGGFDGTLARDTIGDPANFLPPGITSRVVAVNNEITLNQGRGITALTRPGDIDTTDLDNTDPNRAPNVQNLLVGSIVGDLTLIGNHVKGNTQEGVYIMTTNSRSQSAVSSSSVLPDRTGETFTDTFLRTDIHNNQIIGNGAGVANFPATGLVVRVGTTGGNYGPSVDGGFATTTPNPEDLNGDGLLDVDTNGDGILNANVNNQLFGGISMSATGNIFDGNAGNDVLFHSFASTVDPTASSGTWSTTQFGPFTWFGDPLSRLDLIFSNNRFGSIEGNNAHAIIVDTQEPGAYYNNAEADWKSRTFRNDITSGAFASGARIRNAQRLASRYITSLFPLGPNPPAPPGSAIILYPGMGDSTFRVRGTGNAYTDQGLGPVDVTDIFIHDDPTADPFGDPTVVDSEFEANGVFPFVFVGSNGQLPWGWGAF